MSPLGKPFHERLPLSGYALLILAALTTSLSAQEKPSAEEVPLEQPSVQQAETPLAPLVFRDRELVVFRASLAGRNPKMRADAALERISKFIESGASPDLSSADLGDAIVVFMGNQLAFTILKADLNSEAGQTLEEASQKALAGLGKGLEEEFEAYSFRTLLWDIAYCVIATIIFLFSLWLLYRVYRLLAFRVLEIIQPFVKKISSKSFDLLDAQHLLLYLRRVLVLMAWATGGLFAYTWLAICLLQFQVTRAWGEELGAFLSDSVKQVAWTFLSGVPGLFAVVLIILFTRFLVRMLNAFFAAVEEGRIPMPETYVETSQPTRRILVVLLWLFALVMAYPYLPGSGTDAFKGVSVLVGLMISLGSSGLISQGVSGLILMYSRALKEGEYVDISQVEGKVTSVGLLSTKIMTPKREEVNIPNSVILGTTTKNYTRLSAGEGVILFTSVTIGYSTPWRQVHGMLLMAAERTSGIRPRPKPFVLQTALSDFYVEYQLNVHLETPDARPKVRSELHSHIQDVFNEYGVQIMSPHYETDPADPVWVPREKWFDEPAENVPAVESAGTAPGRERPSKKTDVSPDNP